MRDLVEAERKAMLLRQVTTVKGNQEGSVKSVSI